MEMQSEPRMMGSILCCARTTQRGAIQEETLNERSFTFYLDKRARLAPQVVPRFNNSKVNFGLELDLTEAENRVRLKTPRPSLREA